MSKNKKPSTLTQQGYEVEFIPLERRLGDRRGTAGSATPKISLVTPRDRRKQDRRKD